MAESTPLRFPPAAPLSAEAIRALIQRAQGGDAAAKEALVAAHLRLVMSVAARFSPVFGLPGTERDDVFQAGCVGLLKAIERFDSRYPVVFSTYAFPVILGEIRSYLRAQSGRASRPALAASAARRELEERLGRSPTVSELAEATGLDPADAVLQVEGGAFRPPLSLDAPPGGGDQSGTPATLENLLSGPGEEEPLIESLALKAALASLDPQERQMLVWRFLGGESQTAVARRLGLSQAHISRWERRLLQKLREWLR